MNLTLPDLALGAYATDCEFLPYQRIGGWARVTDMWFEVSGGPGPLWVRIDECRLPDGELAFVSEIGRIPIPAWPSWFGTPTDSRLRNPSDLAVMGHPLSEVRSMRAKAGQVLAFYGQRVELGGLTRTEEPQVGRGGPGFSAENSEYSFALDVYEHKDFVFWTVQLGTKIRRRKIVNTGRLLLVGRHHERATLRHPDTGEEYWVPADALCDSEPPDARPEGPRTEPLIWSLLPAWAQFGVDNGKQGEVCRYRGQSGAEEWNASIRSRVDGDPRSVFESCLDSLDANGFDASGTQRPHHSYYVSVLQWGHSLNAHIQSEIGDYAIVTVLNTLGYLSRHIRYSPPQGESPPVSAC
jgi:hypothetical protein